MDFLMDLFSNIKFYVTIIIVGAIVTFVSVFILNHNANDMDDEIYEVTADEILEEYIIDNIQAELKYKGNIIEIRGYIYSIIGNEDKIEIVLNDSFFWYSVTLVFTDKDEIDQISNLHANNYINVIGKVGEFDDEHLLNNLTVDKCYYEE